jgi:hypothetical protein
MHVMTKICRTDELDLLSLIMDCKITCYFTIHGLIAKDFVISKTIGEYKDFLAILNEIAFLNNNNCG